PACTTEADLSKEMRKFDDFPPGFADAIRRFQPYSRTQPPLGDPLSQLNRLWNRDKHRAPLLLSVTTGTVMTWTFFTDAPQSGEMLSRLKANHSVIARSAKPELDNEPNLTIAVALGEREDRLTNHLLPAFFSGLYRHVTDHVMPAFEGFF
ncbi:MAG: hypothetical protein WA809_08580, partial [Candidatus Dormiibacterota bacterium]